MTASKPGSTRPAPPSARNETARRYVEHSTAPRVNTDIVIVESLRAEYPELHLTVIPLASCDILGYAAAGNAAAAPIDREKDRLSWQLYRPPTNRLSGGRGGIGTLVQFGKYLVDWQNKEFVLYVVNGRDGQEAYPTVVNQYVLSPSVEATNSLIMDAGSWTSSLHNEVWVFDQGYWQKSAELWDSVQKARWEDVILEHGRKKAIIDDVENFFNGRDAYERLKIQWKRGVIYYGPPGNGKTISIKAMMHSLYQRKEPVPTLYVRTLVSIGGPEYSLGQIFSRARREAPCLLVFEDLDSIVSDRVRSYFLNEVDGIRRNDGIFMIGSTNHLERLDPGISKRPSRFDRKYLFPNPNEQERTAYMKYWQQKLSSNEDLEFPDKLCPAIAKITPKFSFAYMQEAMVATLLAIARDSDKFSEKACLECFETHEKPLHGASCANEPVRPFAGLYDYLWEVKSVDEEDPDLDNYVLWREIKKQIRILKEMMGGEDESKARA